MTSPSINILRIDSSARSDGSETRALNDALISRIEATANTTVVHRDLAADAPGFVNEAWVGANFTDPGTPALTRKRPSLPLPTPWWRSSRPRT